MAIAAGGYDQRNPLVVSEEHGKYVVIEGNRRLAAVKLLLIPKHADALNVEVPSVPADRRHALQTLPAVVATREDSWRYLGFKHINGPAKWSSYAKARYIADVHRRYRVTLDEMSRHVGDTHGTVHRLYRGIMVLEQAERMRTFDCRDRWWTHFYFSYLYVGLSYPGICNFLGLPSVPAETENPVPAEHKEHLRELLCWMYGSKRESKRPLVGGEGHLRQLDEVVGSRAGVTSLRSGSDLATAYESSLPSSAALEAALLASQRSLKKSLALLPSGYHGSGELLRVADSVANFADDIYREMKREQRPRKESRLRMPAEVGAVQSGPESDDENHVIPTLRAEPWRPAVCRAAPREPAGSASSLGMLLGPEAAPVDGDANVRRPAPVPGPA